MLAFALPVAFAIFVWWFSTGLILLLDRLPKTTFRWSLLISSGLALLALAGIAGTARNTGVYAAYCGFSCALLVWGWHELTFLTGSLTGPRRIVLSTGARGPRRFVEAVATILWHELGILAAGGLILALTWGQPNQAATWTFLVLWIMRTSAKLNLFLGVRNLSEEFLPPHLRYLQSYFRRRPINLLFPVSVGLSSIVATAMVLAALEPGVAEGTRAALVLAGTMLGLAILEHWLLVLPLPATALWRWAMRETPAPPPAEAADARPAGHPEQPLPQVP